MIDKKLRTVTYAGSKLTEPFAAWLVRVYLDDDTDVALQGLAMDVNASGLLWNASPGDVQEAVGYSGALDRAVEAFVDAGVCGV